MAEAERQGVLTIAEVTKGWHWCPEWDDMLITPTCPEATVCNYCDLWSRKARVLRSFVKIYWRFINWKEDVLSRCEHCNRRGAPHLTFEGRMCSTCLSNMVD